MCVRARRCVDSFPLKCCAAVTEHDVSVVLLGQCRRILAGWMGGRSGGLTELTAPVLLSYCGIAFDGLTGRSVSQALHDT